MRDLPGLGMGIGFDVIVFVVDVEGIGIGFVVVKGAGEGLVPKTEGIEAEGDGVASEVSGDCCRGGEVAKVVGIGILGGEKDNGCEDFGGEELRDDNVKRCGEWCLGKLSGLFFGGLYEKEDRSCLEMSRGTEGRLEGMEIGSLVA